MTRNTIRLHLSVCAKDDSDAPPFPARYGHRVKEIGGKYSACRGNQTTRYVTLPATSEGGDLAVVLLEKYPEHKKTFVSGYAYCVGNTWVNVKPGQERTSIARLLGTIRGMELAAALKADDQREQERMERPAKLKEERARLLARLAEIDRELGT